MKPQSSVVGRVNAGKTLFCLRFAKYLGIRELNLMVERTDGHTETMRMDIHDALQHLSDPTPHKTRQLQSIVLDIPRGKGIRQMMLTDTAGLSDGIHFEQEVRNAIAETLRFIMGSKIILHIIDVTSVGLVVNKQSAHRESCPIHALDEQLVRFGESCPTYIILANKMDLPRAEEGYRILRKTFPKRKIIPVSSMTGSGFREVKRHVWGLG